LILFSTIYYIKYLVFLILTLRRPIGRNHSCDNNDTTLIEKLLELHNCKVTRKFFALSPQLLPHTIISHFHPNSLTTTFYHSPFFCLMSLKIHLVRKADGTWTHHNQMKPHPTKSLKRRRSSSLPGTGAGAGTDCGAGAGSEEKTIRTSSLGDWTKPSTEVVFGAHISAPLFVRRTEMLVNFYDTFGDTPPPLHGRTKPKSSKTNEYPTEEQRTYGFRLMTAGERRMIDEEKFVYGQRVTSKHKALTMLDGDRVMKGPIDPKKPMLALLYYRCQKLKEWGDVASVLWDIVQHPVTKKMYISTPNLGFLPENVEYKTVYHFGDVHIRGWCLPRITDTVERQRGGVSRGIDEMRCRQILPSVMWRDLFYHLLLRWVIKGGDTGLWNVINGCGIDFEEERGDPKEGQTPTTLYSLLMETKRKPKASYVPHIKEEVEKWRSFLKEKWLLYFTEDTVFSTKGEKDRAALVESLLDA